MKYVKAVICAGGKGIRLSNITGKILPKSLCRVIDVPFISYQLNILKKSGIEKVYISFNEDWQIQLFKEAFRLKEVPNLKYTIAKHQYNKHYLNVFRIPKLIKFLGKSNYILSLGDLYFTQDIIKKIIHLAKVSNTCVACERSNKYTKKSLWGERNISYKKGSDNKVISSKYTKYSGQKNFGLHTPFYLKNSALTEVSEELENPKPTLGSLLSILIRNNNLSVVKPSTLINVNSIKDLNKFKKLIK